MSYTREQAEEVLKDWNKWQGDKLPIYEYNTEFLNHKFGQQLEVGKWYKHEVYGSVLCYKGKKRGFGVEYIDWHNDLHMESDRNWQPMTDEEVHDFLKSECKKRYKVGDVVKSVYSCINIKIKSLTYNNDGEHVFIDCQAILDLSTGEWAEVIKKDPIAEQIEKLEKELETLKTKYNEQNK
jgi:hypothetical protein